MSTTPVASLEVIAQAKNQFRASTDRLLHLFSFVPDEKLNWSPSATSKSSLHLLTHVARSDQFFANVLTGNLPGPMPSVEEFFAGLHAPDAAINSREAAVALLQGSTENLLSALDGVTAESYVATTPSPVGEFPVSFWVGILNEHRVTHTGQLEYLQTIWGDLDNHMGG